MKRSLIVIVGPTGVGKSQVAEGVALQFNGEILSADSQQVYRGLDIGTGKPGADSKHRIRHHLIDLVNPNEEFNVAMFRALALDAERDIRSRGKSVIVCGGTGLYVKAFLHGLFTGPGRVNTYRRNLENLEKEHGISHIYDRLKRVDPDTATSIHPNDRQRIFRALEVFFQTGKSLSHWQEAHGFKESPFDSFKIGLNRDRKELYGLIDQRCDEMISGGLVEELRELTARGFSLDLKPLQSLGYRQVGQYIRGEKSLEEAVSLMKRDTRRLAKRQLTWFRSDEEIRWFHPEKDKKDIYEAAESFLSFK